MNAINNDYWVHNSALIRPLEELLGKYPVVIITCVQYLGPPGPFSFPDSRDLFSEPPGPSPSQILGTSSRFSEDSPRVRESSGW